MAAPSLAFQIAGEAAPLSLFSAEEVEGFKTLQDIGTWAQIPTHVMDAFFLASGAAPDTMPRAVGVLPEQEFAQLVNSLKELLMFAVNQLHSCHIPALLRFKLLHAI